MLCSTCPCDYIKNVLHMLIFSILKPQLMQFFFKCPLHILSFDLCLSEKKNVSYNLLNQPFRFTKPLVI